MKAIQELFLQYRDSPPIARNMPPIAGALTWCRGLVERIQIPMTKLNQLDRSIIEREEAKEAAKVFTTIVALLQDFETQKIDEWSRDVEQSSQAKLKLPLLVRSPENRHLIVNFDPALVKLLREVKYFLLLGLTVPDSALEIYQQVEIFRRWTGNLDLIVNMNNDVLSILLPVEVPLIQPYLVKFDTSVEKGLAAMNWKSNGITEFIADAMDQVTVVNDIVKKMKDNLHSINEQLNTYNKPLLQRKPKPVAKDEFEKDHKNYVKERYTEIKEGGKHIQTMVKDTNKELRVSNASTDWRSYVEFVNNVVVNGLSGIIQTSLGYLYDQISPENIAKEDLKPMVEVKLDLQSFKNEDGTRYEEVRFLPDLLESNGKGVRDLLNSWIGSFLNVATLFKRLDNEGTYLREMHTDQGVCMYLAIISEAITDNEEKCLSVASQYNKHSYLWTTDMNVFFAEFCADAKIVTENGQELIDLAKFEAAICKYENVRASIQQVIKFLLRLFLKLLVIYNMRFEYFS
jgi:dynein heavy chain, axonemal